MLMLKDSASETRRNKQSNCCEDDDSFLLVYISAPAFSVEEELMDSRWEVVLRNRRINPIKFEPFAQST